VNRDDAAITAAIISMAKSLILKGIAQGVEDEAKCHSCGHMTVTRLKGTTSASLGI